MYSTELQTHVGCLQNDANETDLAATTLDNLGLLEEALHGGLLGTVHIGYQHAGVHGLQEGHYTLHAMVELVIAQGL